MQPKLLKQAAYSVIDEGHLVKLQVGNSILPMTWDVARRMGARIRVALRDSQEFIGMARDLKDPTPIDESKPRKAVREDGLVHEGGYHVYSQCADTILQIGNAKLTMDPEAARNIAAWLCVTGIKVQGIYAPDVIFMFHVAHLSDAAEAETKKQARRDSTVQRL